MQVAQLDQEMDPHHLGAELLDQVDDRRGGTAGGDEVVGDQHLLTRLDGVFVHV